VTVAKVLLVEDEMMIALVIEEVINEAGYEVIHCLTGTDTVAVLEVRATEFRALVTDIQLPGVRAGRLHGGHASLIPE
jgi:DNA-binding response OmpR family regulator